MPYPLPASSGQAPQTQFQNLPAPLRAFLMSEEARKNLARLAQQFSFPDDTLDRIIDLIGDIDFGDRPFSDLLPALVGEINLPEDQAKKFAIELGGTRYLPIAELIGANVWNAIASWGGDPKKFNVTPIATRKVTAKTLVAEIVHDAHIALAPRLLGRLELALISRLDNARDDTQTRDVLTRGEKVGGVMLDATLADHLMGVLRLKLANVLVVPETAESGQQITTSSQRPAAVSDQTEIVATPPTIKKIVMAPPPAPPNMRPTLDEALPAAEKFAATTEAASPAPREDDDTEIKRFKTAMASRVPTDSETLAKKITVSTETVIVHSGLVFSDPTLITRLHNIISARLRDIRDDRETKNLLIASTAKNGMGLSASVADAVINLLEAEFLALHGGLNAAVRTELAQRDSARAVAAAYATAEKTQEMIAAQNERLYDIARKSKVLKEAQVLLPPVNQKTGNPVAVPSTLRGEPRRIKVPPPTLSPSSLPASGKLRLDDVTAPRTISGPSEELRAMTLTEFRRLSKDPREATLKIKDTIDLIKEEGFEPYAAALGAWAASPMNRLYLDLASEAMATGQSVSAVITSRTKANTPTLTADEFQAIVSLNSGLRF